MTPTALKQLARRLETVSDATGRVVAWLTLALVLLVAYDVAMRYLFRAGSVGLQELEWHLFALIFLLGAGYTLKHDEHVRVDIVYQRLHPYYRAWIDFLGAVLFLLPFCAVIIVASIPFVSDAFLYNEGSPDPGGLPYRFLIKAAVPVGFFLLALQGVAMALRALVVIRTKRPPRRRSAR